MKFSLRVKLLIGFIFLLSLSSFMLLFIFSITRQYIAAQVNAALLEKARSASTYTKHFFSLLDGYNGQIEASMQPNTFSAETDTRRIAESIIRQRRFIRSISLYDTKKMLRFRIFSPDRPQTYEPFTQQTDELFDQAASGTPALSSVSYTTDIPTIRMFYPVISHSQYVAAVVEMQIDLQDSWGVLSQIRLGQNGLSYMADRNGIVIAHPDETYAKTGKNIRDRPIISSMLQSTQTDSALIDPRLTEYTNEKGVRVVAQAVKLPETGWLVIFEQPVEEAFAFVDYTRNVILMTGASSIVLLFIVAYILANNLTTPIVQLEEYAKEMEKGIYAHPIHVASHDEIESLAQAFNSMAGKILQRETDLRAEKQQMETMIQSLSDGVIAVDSVHRIIVCNASAQRILEMPLHSVSGNILSSIFRIYDHQTLIGIDTYTLHQSKQTNDATYIQYADKRRVPVSLRISPVIHPENGKQSGWIIAFTDRTRELEIEDLKLDFVAAATHELRTPLTSVRGYAQMLHDEQDHLSDDGRMYLQRLETSAQYLARIIDNIINSSNIERHTFTVHARPLALPPIIEEVVGELSREARDHAIMLQYIPPNTPIRDVSADPIRIKEVLGNLVTNAIHFTPGGGTVTVQITQPDSAVTVSVQDTGIGIPKDALPKLFTKFFRVANALKEGTKGPGLGLYISKTIIDIHQGTIWVESTVDKGSTFFFSLPCAEKGGTERVI